MAAPQTLDPNPCQTAQTPGQCPAQQFFIIQFKNHGYCSIASTKFSYSEVQQFFAQYILCSIVHMMDFTLCIVHLRSTCRWTTPTPLLLFLPLFQHHCYCSFQPPPTISHLSYLSNAGTKSRSTACLSSSWSFCFVKYETKEIYERRSHFVWDKAS